MNFAVDFPALLVLLKFVFAFVASSVGVAALLAVVVNLLKTAGLVKSDQAPMYIKVLSFVIAIVLFVVKVTAPEFDFAAFDVAARALASNILIALPFFMYIIEIVAPQVHGLGAGRRAAKCRSATPSAYTFVY